MSLPTQDAMITSVPEAQPMTADQQQPPPVKEPGSVKRKGKGGKKLSAKERKRRKIEQLEQERLKQLQIQRELEEKKARDLEKEMEIREEHRLQEEEGHLKDLHLQRRQGSQSIRAEKARSSEWERYTKCDHTANPLDQSDINSFISVWNELEDTDITSLFSHIRQATELIDHLELFKYEAEVACNSSDYSRFMQHILDLRKAIQSKIEAITQHNLFFSDHYTGAKNEVLLNAESGGYLYGLWVNLAKNPRIKDIDFGKMAIEFPKAVALTSLAIRMTLSPLSPEFNRFILLSPVLACEFFQLPPPPKRVGGMVLRQVSSSGLLPLPYPLKNTTAAQAPLSFRLKVSLEGLPMENATVVKLDDLTNSADLISGVEVTKDEVKFNCKTTGLFALAIPKYSQFPIQFWEIDSIDSDKVSLFIRTKLTELTIEIDKDGLCTMENVFQKESPPLALVSLQKKGINLVAPSRGEALEGKVSEKTAELEEMLADGLADTATGFRVRSSKWNSSLPGDRAMLLAKEIKQFGEPHSDDEEEETSDWHCFMAKEKHVNEVPLTEEKEEADVKMVEKTMFHQHLMPMFMDIAGDDVKQRVMGSSSFVAESLCYLIRRMRLFSVTV